MSAPNLPWWLWLVTCRKSYKDVFGQTCRCTLRRGHKGHCLDVRGIAERQAHYGI